MPKACAGFDSLRDVDNVDRDDAVQLADQDPIEQQAVDGAALQQQLGADALADTPIPQPRTQVSVENKPARDDLSTPATAHPLGRTAVREVASNGNPDQQDEDAPEPDEADFGEASEAGTSDDDSLEEFDELELETGDGSGDDGGPGDTVLEAGDESDESGDGEEDEDDDTKLYKYDEENDFTADTRTADLPINPAARYRATALEGTRAETLTAEQEVDLAKEIEAGLFAGKLLELLDGTADLSGMDEEEASKLVATAQRYSGRREELEEMAAAGTVAYDEFVGHNLRLAFGYAMKRASSTYGSVEEPMDLVARANVGIVRAVQQFDYTKGYKFSTYATWWMKRETVTGKQNEARTVRLPRWIEEGLYKMGIAERNVRGRLQPGDEVTIEAIAAEMGSDTTPEEVRELISYQGQALSLNREIPGGEGGESFIDNLIIEDETDEGAGQGLHPDPVAQAALARVGGDRWGGLEAELRAALGGNDKHFEALVFRYGLFGNEPHTLEQLASRLGITIEGARQREVRGLAKLQAEGKKQLFERFR